MLARELEDGIRLVGGSIAGLSRWMIGRNHLYHRWGEHNARCGIFRPTTRVIKLTEQEIDDITDYIEDLKGK